MQTLSDRAPHSAAVLYLEPSRHCPSSFSKSPQLWSQFLFEDDFGSYSYSCFLLRRVSSKTFISGFQDSQGTGMEVGMGGWETGKLGVYGGYAYSFPLYENVLMLPSTRTVRNKEQ